VAALNETLCESTFTVADKFPKNIT